jgi:hypothetical protein
MGFRKRLLIILGVPEDMAQAVIENRDLEAERADLSYRNSSLRTKMYSPGRQLGSLGGLQQYKGPVDLVRL